MDLLTPNIVSQIRMSGINAQMLDFKWGPETTLAREEENLTVQLRVRPRNVGARVYAKSSRKFALGSLSVIPASRKLYAETSHKGETVRAVTCSFEKQWLENVNEAPDIRDPFWSMQDSDIQRAMSMLGQELSNPCGSNELFVQCLATEIAILLGRHVEMLSGSNRQEMGCLSSAQLKNLHEFVEISQGVASLAEVSESCGLSPAYLQRMYKKTTGQTLYRLLENARMLRAQALLLETDISLKEITHMLRFCQPSAFSTAFKKATGETPKAFRLRQGWARLAQ